MNHRIAKRFEFDAGHRVLGHEGRCAYIHGHRYVADFTIEATTLDKIGRVIDFGQIKFILSNWINNWWDHNLILHPDDPLLKWLRIADAQQKMLRSNSKDLSPRKISDEILGKQPYTMPKGTNPTVENLILELYEHTHILMPEGIRIAHIRLYETPTSWAEFESYSKTTA